MQTFQFADYNAKGFNFDNWISKETISKELLKKAKEEKNIDPKLYLLCSIDQSLLILAEQKLLSGVSKKQELGSPLHLSNQERYNFFLRPVKSRPLIITSMYLFVLISWREF